MVTLAHATDEWPSALEQSGVSQRRFAADGLSLEERRNACVWRVRSHAQVEELAIRLAINLPARVNDSLGSDPAVLCLAPGNWLLLSERGQCPVAEQRSDVAVTELSDALVTIRLSGSAAPWLLAKLSGLDFLAGRGAGRHCASTRLGRIAVAIHYHDPSGDGFVFDLMADRSVARYLWKLLLDAAPHAGELASHHGSVR